MCETERSNSETSRRQVSEAAKRAIEEARERWSECTNELSGLKNKAKEIKRNDENKIRELEKRCEMNDKKNGRLEVENEEVRGLVKDLKEKLDVAVKDNEIELRKVKGEWALKSERVQVLVCEKEAKEILMEEMKEEKAAYEARERGLEQENEIVKNKLREGERSKRVNLLRAASVAMGKITTTNNICSETNVIASFYERAIDQANERAK